MPTTRRKKQKLSSTDASASAEKPNSDLSDLPHPFVEGGYGEGNEPRCLMELKINKMSYAIRTKPDWRRKIEDPEIAEKWSAEAIQQGLDEKSAAYVIAQVRHLASLDYDPIEISLIDGIFQSENLIDEGLKEELIKGVSLLENVLEKDKDWHPGSDDQVLDLVHPSLYCLVFGVTRKTEGDPKPWRHWLASGEVIPKTKKLATKQKGLFAQNESTDKYEGEYQWIPSEISVDVHGSVKINSYINNLHPEDHKGLYGTLEKILTNVIPMFEKVLSSLKNPQEFAINVDPYSWYQDEEEPDFEDDDDAYENWVQNRPITYPTPGSFTPPSKPEFPVSLKNRNLQVIVKLANIELTPEKPRYPGGVWHVEGMKNESIVATVIYYYVCDNITESRLAFRQAVREPEYEQNDRRGVLEIYGLEDEHALNQELGSVLIKEGFCLSFPNIYQHRVAPFELADKTKKGSRKILVFFLVDPSKPIWSTRNIPPQQKDWMLREMRSDDTNLPAVVERAVHSYVDWPLTPEKAKEYRQKLMDERKYVISVNNEQYFERPFSLCEH